MLNLLLLLFLLLPYIQCGLANVTMKYFETKLDHFALAPGETFNLRYLIDDSNFINASSDKPKPILFYAGSDDDILQNYMASGFVTDTLAEAWGGLVVFGEHRYFGGSFPYNNKT